MERLSGELGSPRLSVVNTAVLAFLLSIAVDVNQDAVGVISDAHAYAVRHDVPQIEIPLDFLDGPPLEAAPNRAHMLLGMFNDLLSNYPDAALFFDRHAQESIVTTSVAETVRTTTNVLQHIQVAAAYRILQREGLDEELLRFQAYEWSSNPIDRYVQREIGDSVTDAEILEYVDFVLAHTPAYEEYGTETLKWLMVISRQLRDFLMAAEYRYGVGNTPDYESLVAEYREQLQTLPSLTLEEILLAQELWFGRHYFELSQAEGI